MTILCNGNSCDIPEGETVAQLLQRLNLNPLHVAVEVNLELCPREKHTDWVLRNGDCVEVVTLVGGG